MPSASAAYLVVRRDDGFGDVFPLSPGQRYSLGRSTTSRIVLKDDLCSREHAEVYVTGGGWYVRDLRSLNGTRVNGERVDQETELVPGDEVVVGRTRLLFVHEMAELPDLPVTAPATDRLTIKKRLGHTRFLTPIPPAPPANQATEETPAVVRHTLSRDLAFLYRLALDMGAAISYQDLLRVVLDGLLDAIPADGGAILSLPEGREPQRLIQRNRDRT